MKNGLIAVAVLALMAVGTRAEPLTLSQDASPEVQRLRQKVDQLETEVVRLKAELALRPRIITGSQVLPYINPLQPVEPKSPQGSVERKFNGSTYYIVPLQNGESGK